MKETQKVLTLSDYEYRVLIESLATRRNLLIEEEKPTEDVSDLLLKAIDAPDKNVKKREKDRDER